MAQQTITGGDGTTGQTGESVKDMINENFTELYNDTAVALVSGASIDITGRKHTLATSLSAITFTISDTSDYQEILVTLSATSSLFTFPVGTLCVSEGTASGDNTCALSGVSGDKYILSINTIGTTFVVCKNFGQ